MAKVVSIAQIKEKSEDNSSSSISYTSNNGMSRLNTPVNENKNNFVYPKKGHAMPVCNLVNRLSLSKLYEEKKAKRCRFYRNGDQWFPGAVIAIASDKQRTWEALLEELTRILKHPQHLALGVRHIFSISGNKITSLEMLVEAGEYVASSTDSLKYIDYHRAKLPQWRLYTRRKEALHITEPKNQASNFSTSCSSTEKSTDDYGISKDVKPKLINILRNGLRPRKITRILLNHRSARSFDQVLNDITKVIKLDTGAVRKVFSITGKQVTKLADFFLEETVFIAYGTERHFFDDFYLDDEEQKVIQPQVKGSISPQRSRRVASPQPKYRPISPLIIYDGSGSLPRSPRKSRANYVYRTSPQTIEKDSENHVISDFYPYIIQSRYEVGDALGDGNFAVVKHCIDKKTKLEFALKIIDKSKCKGKEHMIECEVAILRKINHPHIVSLIEDIETEDYLYLVMELVTGGDLFDAIASTTKYSEEEASSMLKDLVSALHYLHERSIVHRDIKPENLLVDCNPNGVTSIKLGDFGLAVEVTEPLHTVCGTPTYVAPEILAESGYGLKVDIWAAGVITYILLCGFPPFVSTTNNQDELFDQILCGYYEFHSPYWDAVSDQAKDIITQMITVDQQQRYRTEQILNHPWITRKTSQPTIIEAGARNSVLYEEIKT